MTNIQQTDYYSFHGLSIAINCDAAIAPMFHQRLRQFAAGVAGSPDLIFNIHVVSDEAHHLVDEPRGPARPVYRPRVGQVLYLPGDDQLYIDYGGRVRVLCDASRGECRLSVLRTEVGNRWLISHPLFTMPFIELLKRRGLYGVHAAGLCAGDKGLLFAGDSGAGKTTLALALLRAGFGYQGDDTIFLRRHGDGLRSLAFPDEIDVADQTAHLFPELSYVLSLPKSPGWEKRQIQAEELYGIDFVRESKPIAIIFPAVAHARRSSLKIMRRDEALRELIPNLLLTEPKSSQQQLDVLGQLVRETECYRLQTGRDFDSLAALFKKLLS